MQESKTYRIFISHAWERSSDYDRLIELLNKSQLKWINLSIPEEALPSAGTQKRLENQLYDQIKPSQIVIVLASLGNDYRYWVQKEIDIAQKMRKPIIGIVSWERGAVSEMVQTAASEVVMWSEQSIVDAIMRRSE